MAVENLDATAVNAAPLAPPMWFEKSFPKKFQVGTPLTPNIATKFTDGSPSTKNFNPNPGVKLSKASAAVVLVSSDYFAQESLIIPLSTP